jgi:hypothetical protein
MHLADRFGGPPFGWRVRGRRISNKLINIGLDRETARSLEAAGGETCWRKWIVDLTVRAVPLELTNWQATTGQISGLII